jgi:hypothetical protein
MTTTKPGKYELKYKVNGEEKTESIEGLKAATERAKELARTTADGFVNAYDENGDSAFFIEG